MIQLALGIDPEPLSMAPFTIAARELPEATAADFGSASTSARRRCSSRRSAPTSARTSSPGILATGLTLDRRIAALHRRRHELGDRARLVVRARSRRPLPPGLAFEAAQIRCGMRAADGAIEGVRIVDGEVRADGDRRRRAGRPLRVGPRRCRRRARRRGHPRPLGALRRGVVGPVGQDRRGERLPPPRGRLPLTAGRARAAVREGVDRDRVDDPLHATSGSSRRRSRRCCSAARSGRTSPRRAR